MARKKARLALSAAFPRRLKVLVESSGSPGTEGCATWHLLCPQTTLALFALNTQSHRGQTAARPPLERSDLLQNASTPKYPAISHCPKANNYQKKTAVDSKLPLQRQSTGCWTVFPRSSSEMEAAGQMTFARIGNPCHQGQPPGCPAQSRSITTHCMARAGKTGQETQMAVRNQHCHP